MKTYAPSFTNRFAVARPMPLLPPVMSAILPSSLPMYFSLGVIHFRGGTEVGHRNPFEDRAELGGTFLAEGAREAVLRTRPERTAFCDKAPAGGSQRGD